MTKKENTEYLVHVQKRLRVALGFAPARKDIVLLEAAKTQGVIDYVLCRVGTQHYRMGFGYQVEFVDENGTHIEYIPSRFDRAA